MLLVVFRLATAPDAAAQAARVLGLAPAELAVRLRGTLPRVVLIDADADRVAEGAQALEELGFAALACDAASAPTDAERVVARKIELEPQALVAWDGAGERHVCPGRAVALLLRAVRTATTTEEVTTSEQRFAPGRALLSGGLLLTKTVTKTEVKSHEQREPLLLVHRGDGEPDIVLYERRIDYRALGAAMQPSSAANLALVADRMHALAPRAPVDDRAARPGFVTALPRTGADPVDLALFLLIVAQAR
jgi:hypothetical protein